MNRAPSAAPDLPGFEFVRLLGSGGFADVFLYQQQLPRRLVAVKVLLAERLGTSAEAFTSEANVMAQLTHPSIVSVYQAGVSGDGRPYLVMEYCSRPNLQARHRRERFSEAETLRIGVQIAGAVETAHRAGILHRDIKPANILVTEYGRPQLTDFGIAATTDAGELQGMSIPWSPPESFSVPATADASSDVWSLAATLYTLLTNRSPFQPPSASNSEIDVISRVQTMPVPPIGRADVSDGLEAVLQRAMAKNPADRYRSALEFARALQRVQIDLGMAATPIDVVEEEFEAGDEDDDGGRTRFRGITSIDAQGSAPALTGGGVPDAQSGMTGSPTNTPALAPAAALPTAALDATARRSEPARPTALPDTAAPSHAPGPAAVPAPLTAPPAPVGDTVVRPKGTDPVPLAVTDGVTPRRRGKVVGWTVGGVLVALAAAVVVGIVLVPQAGSPKPTHTVVSQPEDPGAGVVPMVTDLAGTASGGQVVFTWTNPDPQSGDSYLWRTVVPGQTSQFQQADQPTATVPTDASGRTCIEVLLVRKDRSSTDEGTQGCAP